MTAASTTLVSFAKCGFETFRLDITRAAWPPPVKKKIISIDLIEIKECLEMRDENKTNNMPRNMSMPWSLEPPS